jgi:hypothetical protein
MGNTSPEKLTTPVSSARTGVVLGGAGVSVVVGEGSGVSVGVGDGFGGDVSVRFGSGIPVGVGTAGVSMVDAVAV